MDPPPHSVPLGRRCDYSISNGAVTSWTKPIVATCCIGQEISTGGGRDQNNSTFPFVFAGLFITLATFQFDFGICLLAPLEFGSGGGGGRGIWDLGAAGLVLIITPHPKMITSAHPQRQSVNTICRVASQSRTEGRESSR